jgi:spermidine/putrescine transport system substrate-binding protein
MREIARFRWRMCSTIQDDLGSRASAPSYRTHWPALWATGCPANVLHAEVDQGKRWVSLAGPEGLHDPSRAKETTYGIRTGNEGGSMNLPMTTGGHMSRRSAFRTTRSAHTRRSLVGVAIVALVSASLLLLAACGGSSSKSDTSNLQNNSGAGKQLTVLTWAGYDKAQHYPAFTAAHPSVKLNWSFMTATSEGYAKLASGYPADLVDLIWCGLPAQSGVIQPIDTSKLTNFANVPDALKKIGQYQGKQYGVPVDFGYSSVLVRNDKVSQIPDSWNALWDQKYKGHVAMYDDAQGAFNCTALALGIDLSHRVPTAAETAQIKQKLIDLKKNVAYFWTDESALIQDMKAGRIWVAYAWTSTYTTLANEGVPVTYITPKEGLLGYADLMEISPTTKNYDLALQLIDAYLEPKAQATFINDWGYGAANSTAIPLANQKLVKQLKLDDPNITEKVFFYPDETHQLQQIYGNTWTAVKASQ